MIRPFAAFAVSLVVLVAGPASARDIAQERFGSIWGLVTDVTGGVLPGVTVSLTSQTTGRTTIVTTGADGTYRAADIEPGRHTLAFELSGFATAELRDVTVLLGKTIELRTVMQVAGFREAVAVSGGAPPLIDRRTPTVAHNVTSEEFARLPKTRTFQSLSLVAPAVNAGEIEGGIQVNGASAAENTFTIDGVVTNSLIHARSRQNAAFEYLQEVQVKTTGIPAEYGGALGGVVSAVTRSGGNSTHGELHYYYEGSALGAGPVPRLVLSPIDDTTVSYVQDAEQPSHQYEPGGSVGGPILRDRVFFFGSVSPQIVRRTNTYFFRHAAEQGTISQKQLATQAFGKVSIASRRVNADVSVLYSPTRSRGTLPPYDSATSNATASTRSGNAVNIDRGYDITSQSIGARADAVLSNHAFLSVRGSYFSDNYEDTGIPALTSVTYQTSNIGMEGVPLDLQGPTGTQNTPRAMIMSRDRTERAAVSADYNATFTAGGRHDLKAGAGFQHTANDVEGSYPGGYVFLYWGRTFSFGGSTGRGQYGYYEVHDRGIRGLASANMAWMYVQDSWAITDRLTLSIGVRTENENIPTYRPDIMKYALRFGFADKIAPRLGAAMDVGGDGRLKVYGHWGRYFDWTKYELPRDSFGADFWTIRYRALDTLDVSSLSLDHAPGTDLWIVPGSYRDQRVPTFDNIDPLIEPTFQDSAGAGVEYQLGPATVVTASYVHNDLRQVIDDVGSLVDGNNVFLIANPGEGAAAIMPTTGPTAPFATPKVRRTYDALAVGVGRRLSRNWFATAHYTYSRLWGNYGGLASSDEIRTPTTGASFKTHQQQSGSIANPGGSVNNAWNLDQLVWDAHGRLDVAGRLATDRPHVFKAYGSYAFRSGTDVGLSFYAGSGTPLSTYVISSAGAEVFVNGRGDMGRTPALTQTNLLLSQKITVGRRTSLRLELNVLNLFNQKTVRHRYNYLNRGGGVARASSAINLSATDLAPGYDYNRLILATPDGVNAYDPRYGMADLFNEGLQAQVLARLVF